VVGCAGPGAPATSETGAAVGGPLTSEQRPAGGVRAVELRTSGNLTLTAGPQQELTITAGREVLPRLTSAVDRGTLVLGSDGRLIRGRIEYHLTLPDLDGLVVAGSGSAQGHVVATGPLILDLSGSGGLELTGLTVTRLTVSMGGSGDIHLTGHADEHTMRMTGSGTLHGDELTTHSADVEMTGSGDARLNVSQRLHAHLRGSGDLTYSGQPTTVEPRASGSGSVQPSRASIDREPSAGAGVGLHSSAEPRREGA
jgi:hypothetical protein